MKGLFSIFIFVSGLSFGQPEFNRDYDFTGINEGFSSILIFNNSYFTAGISNNGGTGKCLVAEFDFNGDTIRSKIFGKDSAFYYVGFKGIMKHDSSFIYIGSEVTDKRRPYAAKLNWNLDTLWTSESWAMGEGDFQWGIVLNDGYVFCGSIESSPGDHDFILLKSDFSGNILWQKNIGLSAVWEDAYSIDTTLNGGFVLSGYQDNITTSWNIYVVKTDSAGNVVSGWPKIFGTNDSEAGWVRSLKDGSYIVWGGWQSGSGNEKAHLRKLLPNGNTIWIKDFQNPGASSVIDVFTDCIETSEGDLVLTGMFYDSTINNPVGWILRTDSLGNEKWRRKLQKRPNDNYLYSIAQTPDGGFVMSGNVFPDGSGNTQDGWIIKVDSMGCLTPGCVVGIEELLIDDVGLLIYPNPNDGKFVVEIESVEWAAAGDSGSKMQIIVTDIFGRVVYEKYINRNTTKIELDISEQAKGIYFLSLITDEKRITSKIIKE
ncbi:MAG: T9SS type A sorting domain-containing protein [Bacteroidota bacterium]